MPMEREPWKMWLLGKEASSLLLRKRLVSGIMMVDQFFFRATCPFLNLANIEINERMPRSEAEAIFKKIEKIGMDTP